MGRQEVERHHAELDRRRQGADPQAPGRKLRSLGGREKNHASLRKMITAASTAAAPAAAPYLSVNNVEVIYDHVILVLKGVSLQVPQGKIVALLGANGAGKSTTLKTISTLLRGERGDVTKGEVQFKGERIDQLTPNELVRRGLSQVMEGRH